MPWIKQWLEALDDPKLTRLSLAEVGAWWGLIMLAGKCGADGKITSGNQALGMDEIADALHIKTSEDRLALESMIAKMEKRRSLEWNAGHTLTIVNFVKRQRIPPSAYREAVAERVRRHRERRKETDEGREVPPSLEVGIDKEVELVTDEDKEVLKVWSGVKDFPRGKEVLGFLAKLKAEFPDVDILKESKTWAIRKLSEPLTGRSRPFSQLWNWMMKAREFNQAKALRVDQGKIPGERKQKRTKGSTDEEIARSLK